MALWESGRDGTVGTNARRDDVKTWVTRGLTVACALVVLYVFLENARGAQLLALAVLGIPLALLAATYPAVFLVAAVALLPFSNDVAGGRLGGVQVAASDVFLALGALGLVASLFSGRTRSTLTPPLRPLRNALLLYFGLLVFTVAAHPTRAGAVVVIQRTEVVLVALLAGVYLAQRRLVWRALLLQVVAAGVLALVTVSVVVVQGGASGDFLGIQKNYAGQAIGMALLLVIMHRFVPVRGAAIGVLAMGLIGSLSRGAIAAVALGLLVQSLGRPAGRRMRQFGLVLAASVLAFATYSLLPESQQARFREVTPGQDYAVNARLLYAEDAWHTFQASPVLGVGPGNYVGTNPLALSTDPHNVLLFEAASGGVLLLMGFLVLNLTVFSVLFRRLRRDPLVLSAIVIQAATLTHGMVDVYWVRCTPVLGWVLVGAALALVHERGAAEAAAAPEPELVGADLPGRP